MIVQVDLNIYIEFFTTHTRAHTSLVLVGSNEKVKITILITNEVLHYKIQLKGAPSVQHIDYKKKKHFQ